jgi:hypothetical protein
MCLHYLLISSREPTGNASRIDFDDPTPINDEEDEETLSAIDEGIRDAEAGEFSTGEGGEISTDENWGIFNRHPHVLHPLKKSKGSCPIGLQPPLHAKSAKPSVRDRGAYRPGRRDSFPFRRGIARSRGFARPVPPHGEHHSQKAEGA